MTGMWASMGRSESMGSRSSPPREHGASSGGRARARLIELLAQYVAGDERAWKPLCELVLRQAVLPVALHFFPGDDDAAQKIALGVFETLRGQALLFDPALAAGHDGCALFRAWAANRARDHAGRRCRLPAAIERLGAQCPHAGLLFRRCVVGGEASHAVIAELAARSAGAYGEDEIEAELVAVERAAVSAVVARQRDRAAIERPAALSPLDGEAPPTIEAWVERQLNREIGRTLRGLIEALAEDEARAIRYGVEGWSWARMAREGDFASAFFAQKTWRRACRKLRADLVARFGEDVLRMQIADGLGGIDED